MRSAIALTALALGSCGGGDESAGSNGNVVLNDVAAKAADQRAGTEGRSDAIECAIGGGAFARSCTMESRERSEGLTVTIRNAEGGFRRLLLPRDGRGAIAADGAEPATVTVLADGRAEVAIAGDRYRLPAAIGPTPPPP